MGRQPNNYLQMFHRVHASRKGRFELCGVAWRESVNENVRARPAVDARARADSGVHGGVDGGVGFSLHRCGAASV